VENDAILDAIIEILENVEFKCSSTKRIKYVCVRGPNTIKSHHWKSMEEDMETNSIDTTWNECTEQEVGQDYTTRMNNLRKLLFVDVLYVMERNNSNVELYKDNT